MSRIAARAVPLLLIGLVLWLVGWQDRVWDASGDPHAGRIVSQTEDAVVLEKSGERHRFANPDRVRRGLRGAFESLGRRPGWAVLGALSLLISAALMQVRWGIMLRGADLHTPWREVFRLGWIGLFFSQVIPAGQVGGDVVKATAIAHRHANARSQAVVSVLAERGIGLLVLCLAAVVGVVSAPGGSRIDVARTVVLLFFAISVGFLALLSWPRLRRALRIRKLLARFPLAERLGAAFVLYGGRPAVVGRAVAAGMLVHLFYLGYFLCAGRAFGADLGAFALLVAIPVAQMAGNLPGLPAGWGVGDFAFFFFLPAAGVPAGTAVALSFTFRAVFMLLSLPGGLLLGRRNRSAAR
ncbi:MAG: lysylphosphatidylglycerol synthase transmembrane domain-containing protein [Planctomycetaceae bacterium]